MESWDQQVDRSDGEDREAPEGCDGPLRGRGAISHLEELVPVGPGGQRSANPPVVFKNAGVLRRQLAFAVLLGFTWVAGGGLAPAANASRNHPLAGHWTASLYQHCIEIFTPPRSTDCSTAGSSLTRTD